MKLTKQLLKEMVLKEMRTLNEGMLTPQNIEQDVRRVIASFQQAQGASQVAMITAEEPPGAGSSFKWDNDEMQGYLKMDLNGKGYDYYPIDGDYGALENSLFVIVQGEPKPNFYDDMVRLGKKYNQDAVIVGQKQESMQMDPTQQGPAYHMEFEMISLHPTKTGHPNMDPRQQSVSDTRDQTQTGPSVQNRQSFFSRAGSFKFVIPFFSPNPSDQTTFRGNVSGLGE
tara:strand:- start:103 stop:783 length:681 start_codon:yes stop_codon:yes gene_type:complete